jgi:hypothetical protein
MAFDRKTECKTLVVTGSGLIAAVLSAFLSVLCESLQVVAFKGVAPAPVVGATGTYCFRADISLYIVGLGAGNAAGLGDPPLEPILTGATIPGPFPTFNQSQQNIARSSNIPHGAVTAQEQAASVRATNQIAASWSSTATSGLVPPL